MAGITDGDFCKILSREGFDLVTLGGYNVDRPTIEAGELILARGRPEFPMHEDLVLSHLINEVDKVKDQRSWKGMISINLRSTSPDPIIQISQIPGVDVVEINAHCRQEEITNLGCGQAMLSELELLYGFISSVVEDAHSLVSVKIRANVPGVDELEVAEIVEDAGADILHVDAMKPGFNCADLEVIEAISEHTSIFLIGNNSIIDVESARQMLESGSDGISIARAAMKGSLNFDLSLI